MRVAESRGRIGGDAARLALRGEELLVEDGGLGEVGDLGRAADVGGGGEDGVLEERAEEGVGAKALGSRFEDGEEFGRGVGGGAGLPVPFCGTAEGEAGFGGYVEEEEEGVAGGDEDLGVVAGGFELGGAGEEGGL